jgi:hypothetical protein
MSDIIVNKENFSRFSKRLKKSIDENLKSDIPLTLVAKMLSNAFGKQSVNDLQLSLDEPLNLVHEMSDKYDHVIEEKLALFRKLISKNPFKKDILSIKLKSRKWFEAEPCIQLLFLHNETKEVYETLLYFSSSSQRLHEILYQNGKYNKLNFEHLEEKHHKFISDIISNFMTDDVDYNRFFSRKLLKYLGVTDGDFLEFNETKQTYIQLENLGYCLTDQWIIVDESDFPFLIKDDYETYEYPDMHIDWSKHNPYQEIELKSENYYQCEDLDEALKLFLRGDKGKILLHALTQLNTGKTFFDLSFNHNNHNDEHKDTHFIVLGNSSNKSWTLFDLSETKPYVKKMIFCYIWLITKNNIHYDKTDNIFPYSMNSEPFKIFQSIPFKNDISLTKKNLFPSINKKETNKIKKKVKKHSF